jgi:hypothetical protein
VASVLAVARSLVRDLSWDWCVHACVRV